MSVTDWVEEHACFIPIVIMIIFIGGVFTIGFLSKMDHDKAIKFCEDNGFIGANEYSGNGKGMCYKSSESNTLIMKDFICIQGICYWYEVDKNE